MSLRRFCDLCEADIPVAERFYDVVLNVKVDTHGDDPVTDVSGDFCYTCTKSGNALTHLMQRYEGRLKKTEPSPTVSWGDTREKAE